MNAIRRIAANIRSSFNALKPNWAILSAWAVMEVMVSGYFGWNLFWFSDAELLADCVLFVVFAIGLYAPAAPVTNVTNYFSECECKDDVEETFEEKYGSGCQGYGCEGCEDCKTDDTEDEASVDTETDEPCSSPDCQCNADRRA